MENNDGRVRQYMIEELRMPLMYVEDMLDQLKKYPDLYGEFCGWLLTRRFPENGLEIEGYSAMAIAKLQPILSGLAVYLLLINLRDDREKTLQYLQEDVATR